MIAEETRALLRRAQAGDVQAAEQMVEENTGLIWSVARRFFGRGVEPDDLYQLGCVGFLKAMQGFDEQFGTCFLHTPSRRSQGRSGAFCAMTARSRSAAA